MRTLGAQASVQELDGGENGSLLPDPSIEIRRAKNGFRCKDVINVDITTSTLPPNDRVWNATSLLTTSKESLLYPKVMKMILSFLFGEEGPLLIDWLQPGVTVNGELYCNTRMWSNRPSRIRGGQALKWYSAFPGQRYAKDGQEDT